MHYIETSRLENAYKKFGNVAYIDHWYNAMQDAGYNYNPLRNVDEKKPKAISLYRRPSWYQRACKLEYKPYNRLDLSRRFEDTVLITCGKTWLKQDVFSFQEIERIARKRPNIDWRIEIIHAFESFVYQRQGRNKWVLIEVGKGYA